MLTDSDGLRSVLASLVSQIPLSDVVFVCIGTDRSTGDSLGPLVGTYLQKLGYTNVIGTLDEPVNAVNLTERLKVIDGTKKVIAIDACLGQQTSVGRFQVAAGPLKPGAGVNKELPAVGDYHIKGIVNVGGFMEYFVLQNTRLFLVIKMARAITDSIVSTFSIPLLEVAAANEGEYQSWQ